VVAARARPHRRPAISDTRVRIDPFATEGTAGHWAVRWHITNDSNRPLRLISAIQPHSQFRTPETPLDLEIGPGAAKELRLAVRFDEKPANVIENAFLIVVVKGEPSYRILARVRVTAGTRGEPLAGRSVVITTQTVGIA
jgi:hypothetical protein